MAADTPVAPYRVIATTPRWELSGVNTFSAYLVRELRNSGIDAFVLLTGGSAESPAALPEIPGVPIRTITFPRLASWNGRWRTLSRYLEAHAPCVYLPGYDFVHSCVTSVLPREVVTVGIVHSDEDHHYEHALRLGRYWDAAVAVSRAIADHMIQISPSLAGRTEVIPYGVDAAARLPAKSFEDGVPLRIVYAGRLEHLQKRVLDLESIARALATRDVPFELEIIGTGLAEAELRQQCSTLPRPDRVRFAGMRSTTFVAEAFAKSDVFLLTSDYEGLPLSLLEAMGQGCVPVVTDIRSGVPEVVRDGVNGYLVPVGDIDLFAERLRHLQQSPHVRRAMRDAAHRTIVTGGYRSADMALRYRNLFERLIDPSSRELRARPRGVIQPHPSMGLGAPWRRSVPCPLLVDPWRVFRRSYWKSRAAWKARIRAQRALD